MHGCTRKQNLLMVVGAFKRAIQCVDQVNLRRHVDVEHTRKAHIKGGHAGKSVCDNFKKGAVNIFIRKKLKATALTSRIISDL